MNSQPVTPLRSPPLPTLRDPFFNIFLWDNLNKTDNEIGKMTTLTMLPSPTFWESPSDIKFYEDIELNKGDYVMNIKWDYNYYQPWSDNKWLVDEMLAILDEAIIIQ